MGQIQGESFLFTQQLAENQQVGTHSSPTRTRTGHVRRSEAEEENWSASDQTHQRTNQWRRKPRPLCWLWVLLQHLFDTLAL